VPNAAISLENVGKSFPPAMGGWRAFWQPFAPESVTALEDVSLEVRPGEAVALLGANGAGKSTLLRIVATLLLPTRGRAMVAGYDAAGEAAAVRRCLGYHAGTDHGFYPRLSARENLLFFGELNGIARRAAERQVAEFAERFDLNEALPKQVRTLSSGTVQRLSLLRALLHEPKVLLLDEPTRSLDVIAAAEFRNFLKDHVLRGGTRATLFASHTLAEVEMLADRVAIIDRGRLLACDSVAALKRRTGAHSLEELFFRITGRAPKAAQEVSVE
jgi:ABC-type multidrug transport system ATPase subunit